MDVQHRILEFKTLMDNILSNAFAIMMIFIQMINIIKTRLILMLKLKKEKRIELQHKRKERKMLEEKLKLKLQELLLKRKLHLKDWKMLNERPTIKDSDLKEKESKKKSKKRRKRKTKKRRKKKLKWVMVGLMK